jgi:hypothetical protein
VAETGTTYPQKITFGEMRASGVRDELIYCRDHRCGHHIEINANSWADDVRPSDIEPKVLCTKCWPLRRRGPAEFQTGQDGQCRMGSTGPVRRASLWPSLRRLAAFVKQAISRAASNSRGR